MALDCPTLNANVSQLKNIGPKRLALLNRLGIFTVEDLVCHFPRDYQDRSKAVPPWEVTAGTVNTVLATVNAAPQTAGLRRKAVTKLMLGDKRGFLEVVWFNQPYLRTTFTKGSQVMLTGMVTSEKGKMTMRQPDFEVLKGDESLSFGRIIPIYPATAQLSQKILRSLIHAALQEVMPQFAEVLPGEVQKTYGLCSKDYAVTNIHFPENDRAFFVARKRLVFEELLVLQLALFEMKGMMRRPCAFQTVNPDAKPLLDGMPFAMTGAQQRTLAEIREDLTSGFVMNRLIQGDVGSGKTAVAMAAVYIAVAGSPGAQGALMAPTEVLATQHYQSCKAMFEPLGLTVTLLVGAMTAKAKRAAREQIASGESRLIIGTHALIQDTVDFYDLRLVITDEQHRFGVRQRAVLQEKGVTPHVLVMTATPIPRTLALILYGDMDVSIMNEMPPGRSPVRTYRVNTGYRERLYAFMAKEIDAGRQCYVICPLIEESEKLPLQAVTAYVEKVAEALRPRRVECLHGKMTAEEKNDLMTRFAQGDIDVLVSTTVIEVGINVPNATVMVVENAERFGLAQLHQLRGRVGRGAHLSTCVLVTDSESTVCQKRMAAMTQTHDGFVISDMDLKLRGPGDFFGTKQHGLPELRIANLYQDMEILKQVQGLAKELADKNALQTQPAYRHLANAVHTFLNHCLKKVGL